MPHLCCISRRFGASGQHKVDFSALGFTAWELGQRWLRYGKPAQMSQRVVKLGAQPVTQNKQHTTKSSTRKHAQGADVCACPVLIGFVSSPAAGAAKKKGTTPHGHLNRGLEPATFSVQDQTSSLLSYVHADSYIPGYINDQNYGHHAIHCSTSAFPAADRPRFFGGLGSSELIARLGGWHLERAGRAYLMPGINRATAARGFPGLRSAIRHFPKELQLDCTWPAPRLALAMYVPNIASLLASCDGSSAARAPI